MSNRNTTLFVALFALLAGCIDRSLNVNDPNYPDDGYTIAPEWSLIDTNNLRPMALYRIPITLGENAFKSLAARFSNDTILDTALFNQEIQNNRLALYFISSGVCTLTIDGLHPNNRHTVVSKALCISNPYRISGDSLFGLRETGAYNLLPVPLFDFTNLDLMTGWQLDTGTVTTLAPPDTFTFSFIQTGRMVLRALLIDTLYGHRLLVDSINISVPGNRPTLDSLLVVTNTLFPGQQPRIQLFANDKDSGSLKTVICSQKKGIWTDTFNLTGPLMYSSILTSRKPLIDTGTMIFSVMVIDSSGLVSNSRNDSFKVIAHPPAVRFIPDTAEIALFVGIQQTVLVSATADTFVWTIDGEDTVTVTNHISRIFLTDAKKTANVSVYGIDRYGYRGPMASVRIVEEKNAYDCTLYGPGDSSYFDRACWTAITTRRDRVNEYGALFYWEIMHRSDTTPIYRDTLTPLGDSSSTLCLSSLSIPGISFDSIDIKIAVFLKDDVGENHVSQTRTQICAIRPFRPVLHIVDVLPRSDSIATDQEVFIRFDAEDANRNGSIDSLFWKATGTASITALSPSVDSLTFAWTTEGTASILLWARDNDGEISDTVRVSFVVIKNRPRITKIDLSRPVVYSLERCTLSVSAERGILRAPVEKTRWRFPGNDASVSDTTTLGTSLVVSFTTPGKKAVSAVAIDARGDSSLPFIDSITIVSGKPTVIIVSQPDSVSTRLPARIVFALSDLRSTIDTVFWRNAAESSINAIAIPCTDSGFSCSWLTPGTKIVEIWAKDILGDVSDTESVSIVVVLNQPIVSGLYKPQAIVYTHHTCTVSIAAQSGYSRAGVAGYHWAVVNDASIRDTVTNDSNCTFTFESPGTKDFSVFVTDSLGDSSAAFRDSIVIDPGKPAVSAVLGDSIAESWINDSVSVRCSARDTNGLIKKLICDWADGSADTVTLTTPAQNVSDTFIHQYSAHGAKTIRLIAIDDDGLSSVDTVGITIKKGAPTVRATEDTFVWYDNKGYTGDTLNLNATASDSNGTIVKYVWILKAPLDSSAKAPDTVVTLTDHLVAGGANTAFWGDHQPSYFRTDSTYKGAVYVIDDDGLISKPDTFYFYIDAPRSPITTVEAKDGFNGNHSIFELTGGTSLNDSLIIKLQNIAPSDTNYLEIRISLIIDSLVLESDPTIIYNDTLSLAADTSFALIKTYETKQGQSEMVYSGSSWKVTYRPYTSDFIKYKQSGGSPWLYFRALVELRLRTGVIQKAVSPQSIKMSHTLTTFD
jgi:hypothetical protein